MKIIILATLFVFNCFSQNTKDTLYVEYDDVMRIVNKKTVQNDMEVMLSFTISSTGNTRPTTYNFLIDNMGTDFTFLEFEKLRDTVNTDFGKKEIMTLDGLSQRSACELFFLFADIKKIILLKKERQIYYRYNLKYFSTQRGWEYVRMD